MSFSDAPKNNIVGDWGYPIFPGNVMAVLKGPDINKKKRWNVGMTYLILSYDFT